MGATEWVCVGQLPRGGCRGLSLGNVCRWVSLGAGTHGVGVPALGVPGEDTP